MSARTKSDDYADTAGRRRKENDTTDGTQRGGPSRGAAAIVDTISRSEPPFRLLLGTDAIEFGRHIVSIHAAEIEDWASVSATTDFANEAE